MAQASSEKNRIIKILEDANIKLSNVLTNVDGVVGSKIIDNLIEDKTDIDELLKFYHGKIKASRKDFRFTIEGKISKHHRFILQLHKDSIADKERLMERIETEIDEAVKTYQVEVGLLQTIPGVG